MRHVMFVALLFLPSLLAAAPPDVPGELAKPFAEAFRPFRVPPASALRAEIEDSLPQGIVTEAGPFDALVLKLRTAHEPPFEAREEALKSLAACPSPQAGKLVQGALRTITAENEAIRREIAAVEAVYAKVYNVGFLDGGESSRHDRSATAVLIPYYRTLLCRGAEVSARAADALAAMKDGESLAWLIAESGGKTPFLFRRAALEALGRIGGDESRAALSKAVSAAAEPAARAGSLLALMSWPIFAVREPVLAALADPAFEVRGTAIRICAAGKFVGAVEPLIDALAKEQGRLRTDIDRALGEIVGVRFEADPDLWARWWRENADAIREKARLEAEAGEPKEPLGPPDAWGGSPEPGSDKEDKAASATFYGISTLSRRVLFIVDISKSMENDAGAVPAVTGGRKNPYEAPDGRSKLAVAKWQLHRAIHDLPDKARFNILVYSESYRAWGTGMQEAGGRTKAAAHRFVDELSPNGTTNICDPLEAALAVAGVPPFAEPGKDELGVDTIFLLSDGDPNRGRVSGLADLLAAFTTHNLEPWITVHAVGIGEAAGSSFLENLAAQNGGRYVGFR